MSRITVLLFVLSVTVFCSPVALAHGGKTNSKGCHPAANGQVHCHGKSAVGGSIKRGPDGRCYPPSHPDYKKIKAVKVYPDFQSCMKGN